MSDESSPAAAVTRMDEILARFVGGEGAENALSRSDAGDGATEREARYRIEISSSAKFDAALDASVAQLPYDDWTTARQLRALARGRFEDWPLVDDDQAEPLNDVAFQVAWRGTERPGRLLWQNVDAPLVFQADAMHTTSASRDDWQTVILAPGLNGESMAANIQRQAASGRANAAPAERLDAPIAVVWQPAEITPEEATALRRMHALRRDATLITTFGETAHAAISSLLAQAERMWTRIYINDSVLFINGIRRNFTDRAGAAQTIGDALSQILAPHFGERYVKHPLFVETLGEAQVELLIEGLFSSTGNDDPDVQLLARVFAEPLGLATIRGNGYALETGDAALSYGWVREVLALVDSANGEVVPIETVRRALRCPPYGLLREAQHLVLAALVAQRRIELVTPTGDRISRRTLGRAVKWEEVAGVARAAAIQHDAGELTAWARLLTGDTSLTSITEPTARAAVRTALSVWLDSWREQRLLEDLNALPDAALTTRLWKMASAVRKSFGASAEAVEAALATDISLEEGLQRVADAFSGSTDNFARVSSQLEDLIGFITGIEERERARAYLSAAEATGDEEIESARRELLKIAADPHHLFDAERRARFDLLWHEFHTRYTEHYATLHERTVGAGIERRPLDSLLRGESWREFELLAELPIVNRRIREEAERLIRHAELARCDLPVRQVLASHPACACPFRLSRAAAFERLPEDLEEVTELGLAAYRRTLTLFATQLERGLDALAADDASGANGEAPDDAQRLARAFATRQLPRHFTRADVRLIKRALEKMDAPPPVRVSPPTDGVGLVTREELSARLRQWLDDLPQHAALVELATREGEADAP
jgi:hypothetical protein